MKIFRLLLLLMILPASALAQERLGNADIMQMVREGIPESLIITKIRNSFVDFDTTTTALSELVKANVPEPVIAAMIERRSSKNARLEITFDAPENGTLEDLKDLTKVYLYVDDAKAREILTRDIVKYPRFTSVDSIEKADFILAFKIVGYVTNAFGQAFMDLPVGELYAVKLGGQDPDGKTRVRVFYSVRHTKNYPAESHPAKTGLEKFIKDFKKMRGER